MHKDQEAAQKPKSKNLQFWQKTQNWKHSSSVFQSLKTIPIHSWRIKEAFAIETKLPHAEKRKKQRGHEEDAEV